MRKKYFYYYIICITLINYGADPEKVFAQSVRNEYLIKIEEVISGLTGHTEVKNNIRLPDRSTAENKKIAADYLFNILKETGLNPERQEYRSGAENIYAVLRSTIPSDEFVIIGAHYDTVPNSPGANDNASGIAFVYGAALRLIEFDERSLNFIFVFFDEEERGLRGSSAFAQKMQDDGLSIHSVHTIDQFGWDGDGDKAIELELPYDGIVDVYRQVLEEEDLDVPLHISDVPATDHTAFRRLGYNAVGITEEYKNGDTTPHYHRPSDTYDTIDFEYLEFGIDVFVKVLIRILGK
ncbi:M28 family metallopeptidase [candidate division KSB1 bacterium]